MSDRLADRLMVFMALNAEEANAADRVLALTECIARLLVRQFDPVSARFAAKGVIQRLSAHIDMADDEVPYLAGGAGDEHAQ